MKKFLYMVLLAPAGWECKQVYEPPYTAPSQGFLVVEGVLNSGQGPTVIRLSRTVGLIDTVNIKQELHAQVTVEGQDNSSYPLPENGNGEYINDQLSLNATEKYRLRITTADGKEYVSDYRPVLKAPAIDSISWERNNGVDIFVNTHDPQNNTLYYRWETEETWEFHSPVYSTLQYVYNANGTHVIGVEERPWQSSDSLFTCWKSENSTSILIGSSVKFSRDSIHQAIVNIPEGSWKLSVLYSINVRQFALSKEGHDFLQRMKKNTEQTGTLFDPQPSQLNGNIHCVSNPGEPVIGFIEITNSNEKRIFISRSELDNWDYRVYCEQIKVLNNADSLDAYSYMMPTMPIEYTPFGTILYINVAASLCVDCTIRGTNTKPSFWP